MTMLTRQDILRGLRAIDDMARAAGVVVDLSIYGGAALALVKSFYPSARIPAKVRFGVEEIMERVVARRAGARAGSRAR